MSTKCPRSLTSLGGIASKFKTAVGKIANGGPGVQSSLPVVVSFAHTVPGTYGLASVDIVDRGVGVSATSTLPGWQAVAHGRVPYRTAYEYEYTAIDRRSYK